MRFIKRFARFKVYFERARGYVAYASFLMLILTWLKVYEESNFGQWVYGWGIVYFPYSFIPIGVIQRLPVVIASILFGLFILGYYDKIYVRPHEQAEIIKTNPIFMDMKRKIDEIHKNQKR